MPNLEAHQQVQCDSNECASDAGESLSSWQNVPSEVSGSSGIPPSPAFLAADLAAIRDAQRHQHLDLSEKHLQQLKKRRHDAEEAFRKEWQLTHDRLGSASMASHLEACLEKARAAPLEHSTGLLGQYAAWHQEVLQLEEKLKQKKKETAVSGALLNALREDQPSCAAKEEPQTWEPQRREASRVSVAGNSSGLFKVMMALAVGVYAFKCQKVCVKKMLEERLGRFSGQIVSLAAQGGLEKAYLSSDTHRDWARQWLLG